MTNWKCDRLGSLISYISKGIPPKYEENKNENTIIVLNQKCNRDFKISFDNSRFHNNLLKPVNESKILRRGDILINSTGVGTAGRIAQIWNINETTTFDGHMILIRNNDLIDPIYFGYAVKAHQKEIELLAEGSTGQTEINRSRLCDEIRITYPVDKSDQKRIGEFLLNLDDKILLNNKINDNLEQQAQAIFKSWFIDYEPFKGVRPNDWESHRLGSVCKCELGGTPSRNKPEYWNGSIPWINSGEVNLFRIIKPSEFITDLGLRHSATKLLPSKTTVIAITGATLGQVSLLEIEACANQSVVGVIPNEQLPYEFIYPYIKANINELLSHQTGGAQQHINKQNIKGLLIVIPEQSTLEKYVSIVSEIYGLIANNCFENKRLIQLRNELLPKLMSGETDVSELKI